MANPPSDIEKEQKFLYALESGVSAERWTAYRTAPDEDNSSIAGTYAWNVALCESLYPVLHVIEITLRNRIFGAAAAHFQVTGYFEVNCWLDANPRVLLDDQVEYVIAAKKSLRKRLRKKFSGSRRAAALVKAHMTPGRLVSELHFGFWTYLFDTGYAAGPSKPGILWPTLLPIVFPHNPGIQRHEASRRLVGVRQLRNRIFHHEEIWRRPNLWTEYSDMLELLSWMSPEAASVLHDFCQFPSAYREPPNDPGVVPRHFRMMIRRIARRS